MGNGHAVRSPSGAERWMTCPGSVAMEEGLPDTAGSDADEGTAAHFLASTCLTGDQQDAVYFIGRSIAVWEHSVTGTSGACFKEDISPDPGVTHADFKVDVDMAGYVRSYVKSVLEYAKSGTLLVEQEVPIGHLTGEDGASGTSDAIILEDDLLTVIDLKYGYTPVSPVENKQALMYASGAIDFVSVMGSVPKRVRIVIHQPRVSHNPSEWLCSLEDVRAFEDTCRERAKDSRIAYEFRSNWLGKKSAYLVPSESGCRYCRAGAQCAARDAAVSEAVGVDFDVLPDSKAVASVESTGITLSEKMASVGAIENWCKAVRAEVERRLFEDPASVPGYKIVQGKKGNRKWADEEAAEKLMKEMRLKHDVMYNYSVVSPPQAEKAVAVGGIGPRQWSRLGALVTRSEGKPSVAKADDPRQALAPVIDAFDSLTVDDGSDLC